jgi:hypothetical protein
MAFIGLAGILLVLAIAAGAVFLCAVAAVVAGTLLIRHSEHKKLGTVLRVGGIAVIAPVFIIIITVIIIRLNS